MNNRKINEQTTDGGGALEQFKTAMSQLSSGLKGKGGSKPTTSSQAPQAAKQPTDSNTTSPTGEPVKTNEKQPTASKPVSGGPSKEVGTKDLAKKIKELGLDPEKAAALLQYYGIKIVKQ